MECRIRSGDGGSQDCDGPPTGGLQGHAEVEGKFLCEVTQKNTLTKLKAKSLKHLQSKLRYVGTSRILY